MRTIQAHLLVALAFALVVGALAAADSAETQRVAVDKWEIPFLNSVTGVAAGYGALCDFFQKAATEEINAAGGIAGKPLAIQDCDTAMDPTRATSCMKKAVEKSLVIIGPMTSLDTQVTGPIAAKEGVMIIPAAGGVETIQPSRPWAIALMIPNRMRAEFEMDTWTELNPGIKKVVMLGLPTVAQWKVLGELQTQALEKKGVKVVDNIDVAAGAVDVSSIVVRALKSQPDGIVTRLMPADTVRIIAELAKRGFTKKERIHNHQTVDTPELYSMSAEAGNVMDGTYISSFSLESDAPENQKLLAGLRKQKGQANARKLMWCDSFYVSTYLVKDAIEKTGATGDPAKLKEERTKIRDYLNSLKNWDTRVWGGISVLPDGGASVPMYLMQIRNNKPVVVRSSRDWKPRS